MTQLSVNVNKLATLRNSRGKNNPDVVQMALSIITYGAEGITVHPRPDGRHIRTADVFALKEAIDVELNIEGYPSPDFLALVQQVRPAQCTLVPDPPEVLTSNAGWQVTEHHVFLTQVVKQLQDYGVRTSLFIDPKQCSAVDAAHLQRIGTDRVELYTEAYAEDYGTPQATTTLLTYQQCAQHMIALGIGLNAGHDLNLTNLRHFVQSVPGIQEVSIGHALICDALELGMQISVERYLSCLKAQAPALGVLGSVKGDYHE
jgi:pyridoxine 5-phosphate synthase